MGAALWGVIHQAHTEEIGDLAEQILPRWPDTTIPLLADVAATAATCRYMLGDDDSAIRLATEMLEAAERSPYAGATLRRAIAQAQRHRKSTRLNSSHQCPPRMPSYACKKKQLIRVNNLQYT